MFLTDREQQIIKILMSSKEYVSSYDIARKTGISRRVIREEMKHVKSTFNSLGFEIDSKTGEGYKVIIETKDDYNYLIKEVFDKQDTLIPNGTKERVVYITKKLLLENMPIKIDDLAEELAISRSSISNDLKSIRENIKSYNLVLNHRPNYGIKIEGKELNRRKCLSEVIFNDGKKSKKFNLQVFQNAYDTEKIYDIVLKHIEINKLELTDIAISNLVLHICIAFSRIKNSSYIPMEENELKGIKKEKYYDIAFKLNEDLKLLIDVDIPESEIAYIAMHLSSKRILEDNKVIDEVCKQILEEGFNKIYELYNFDFRNNSSLYMALGVHLAQTIKRLKYNLSLKNPLLDDIKQKYNLAYDVATVFCSVIEKHVHKKVTSNEISYFALHFWGAVQEGNSRKKTRVLVVCGSGRGTSSIVSYFLKSELGDIIDVIGESQVYKLKNMDFEDVDYVLSTVPIQIPIPVPSKVISPFLEERDIKELRKLLSGSTKRPLHDFFDKNLFKNKVTCKSIEDVLSQMVELLKKELDGVPEDFYDQLMERENMSSTEFGNGIAIPHPIIPIPGQTIVTVFILEKPIRWYKKKIQIIFLTSIESTQDFSVNIYHALARLAFNKAEVNQLLKKPTYQCLVDTLNRIERTWKGE